MGVEKSHISSLSHVQLLQFNFYFADESQVYKKMLKKHMFESSSFFW